jgi:hypothetical protein
MEPCFNSFSAILRKWLSQNFHSKSYRRLQQGFVLWSFSIFKMAQEMSIFDSKEPLLNFTTPILYKAVEQTNSWKTYRWKFKHCNIRNAYMLRGHPQRGENVFPPLMREVLRYRLRTKDIFLR